MSEKLICTDHSQKDINSLKMSVEFHSAEMRLHLESGFKNNPLKGAA
jgi:hypothetical protein